MKKDRKEYKKLYYEKNKEKIKEKVLEWREKNKEKHRNYNAEYSIEYNKNNKERKSELNKGYYKKKKKALLNKQVEKQLYIIDNTWIIDFVPTVIEAVYMCSNLTHLSLEQFKVVYFIELSHPSFNGNQLCNVEPNEDSDSAKTYYVIYEIDKEDRAWDSHYTIKIVKAPKLLDETIKKSLNK